MKKLHRNTTNKIVAGVCSGLAEYFKLDPTLIRLIWAFVVVFTGIFPGVIVYLIAWAVMPEKTSTTTKEESKLKP